MYQCNTALGILCGSWHGNGCLCLVHGIRSRAEEMGPLREASVLRMGSLLRMGPLLALLLFTLVLAHGTKAQQHQQQQQHHLAIPTSQLPCCPAACPLCVQGPRKRRGPAIHHTDGRGAEYAMPQVVRRPKPLGHLKDGDLLGAEGHSDATGYTYEKGRLKPVLMLDDRELYLGPQWEPLPVCEEGSDCPCYNCQCCYTETVQCTVLDYCEATVTETTTLLRTFLSTKYFSIVATVTASLIFTLTNTLEFRSTDTSTTTLLEPTIVTSLNTTEVTTPSILYVRTETARLLSLNATITLTAPTLPTITVRQDVISIIQTKTTFFGGFTTLPGTFTRLETESVPSYWPFTVLGKARTFSSTLLATWHYSSTLRPVTEYLTPGTPVATTRVTTTQESTRTATVTQCPKCPEATVRVTPTKTMLRTLGTATPEPVTCCDKDAPYDIACPCRRN